MPYVEGFGTWPFGEEWLWEAIATAYLPLLDVLDAHPGRVTLSLTPVLCDQLEAPGALERCLAFLREIRAGVAPARHRGRADAGGGGRAGAQRGGVRGRARTRSRARGDLVAAFAPHVAWTSAATHAVLPLLATEHRRAAAAARRHRRAPRALRRLGRRAVAARVRARAVARRPARGGGRARRRASTGPTCSARARTRRGARAAGVVLAPIDREAIELVWQRARLPVAAAPYLDTHRLTEHRHRRVGDRRRGVRPRRGRPTQVAADAEDFVERVAARGGVAVVALDTELLGHFWPEGIDWLRGGARGVRAARAGARAARRGAGRRRGRRRPRRRSRRGATGATCAPGAGPRRRRAGLAQRGAELRAFAAAARPGDRALRELLALQSSDWAFLATRGTAGRYPRERADGHRAAFEAALADPATEPALRNLAPLPLSTELKLGRPADHFRRGGAYSAPLRQTDCNIAESPSPRRRGAGEPLEPDVIGSRGESPPSCGVAQVFARARQLTP